jgi:2-polyprenyl-3-methyl-5-hydroxy-6-metoxy-1,4-benzoquinol methylase
MSEPKPAPTFENAAAFAAWNEEMSRQCDPGEYFNTHNRPVRWIERSRMRTLLKLANVQPDDKVLDIGCGTGDMLLLMNATNKTGIDLSKFMLRKAHELLGSTADLKEMPAEKMTFADESFDVICCSEVLEHVMDPAVVLREIHRVLKRDGVAVISIPNESMINRIKRIAISLGLTKLIFALGDGTIPLHNKWHLHNGSLNLFKQWNGGLFRMTKIRAVPFGLLPVRYVIRLEK